MAYQKPTCECGEELIYWTQKGYTEESKILKSGKIAKRPYHVYGNEMLVWDRLKCNRCYGEYHIEHDSSGRVIRGEKWDS
ncbi:hypothetical protein ABEV55_12300 [Aneurinibacillus thermoaerophilus]|uniref:hypothetical protein n=1 Tax=Aneurinibacillus thermoaerophilus TaxID=143495 RepID=UPI002E230EDA|nr:hypothetical protein [Aneurinibacillus thermoaerophilus]